MYLAPLMIGARDMAFPRLNAFTYWSYLLSGVLLYVAPWMCQAPHARWFSYVPYTSIRYSPSHGMDFYALALIFLTISTTGGAANFIVTIQRLRETIRGHLLRYRRMDGSNRAAVSFH